MDDYSPPPEVLLVERQRKLLPRQQSAVSKVASAAGLSEGRWRQIAKGYQQVDKNTRVKVVAPADTLARMAAAVGLTADEIAETGRDDAAAILRNQLEVKPAPANDDISEDLSETTAIAVGLKPVGDYLLDRLPEGSGVSDSDLAGVFGYASTRILGELHDLIEENPNRKPDLISLLGEVSLASQHFWKLHAASTGELRTSSERDDVPGRGVPLTGDEFKPPPSGDPVDGTEDG